MMGKRCFFCDKCFSSISTFNRHLKQVHNQDPASIIKNIICPNESCRMKFARKVTFFKHLEEVHRIKLEFEKKEFSEYSEFQAWRDEIIRETDCSFTKIAPSKLLVKGEKVLYFNCNRCGFHNSNARIRKYSTCPSLMNVVITDDKVRVKFQKTHYGHSADTPHSPITDQAYKLVPGEEEGRKNIPYQTFLSDEQNLSVSDFSDSHSSSDFKMDACKPLTGNASSSKLLEYNRQKVALLLEKLNSISSVDERESILLESNKREMALLSEKLNSISSIDKNASVEIKCYLSAIEHLIEVQASITDSVLTN